MKSRKRIRLVNFILVIFGILFALVLAELILRFFPVLISQPESSKIIYQDDSTLIHVGDIEKSLILDDNGFKNKEILSSYDIVALGDSHTMGEEEVDWVEFLKQESNLDIYNMGVAGYGPAQYSKLIDQALEFNPKLVIVALYLGNDIFDAYNVVYNYENWQSYKNKNFVNDNSILELDEIDVSLMNIKDWLRSKSYLYKLIADRTRIIREKLGLAPPKIIGTLDWTNTDPNASLLFKDSDLETIFWSASRSKGLNFANKNITEGLNLTISFLEEIKTKTDNVGSKVLFVLLPTKEVAYSDLVGRKKEQNKYFKTVIEGQNKAEQELELFCSDFESYCLNISSRMQTELENGNQIYYNSWNDHPNKEGYKVYADEIWQYLQNFNIIDLNK